MTKGELIALLQGVPNDAVIYVESDHGQTPEQAAYISFVRSSNLPFYGDDLPWSDDELMVKVATAVLIN